MIYRQTLSSLANLSSTFFKYYLRRKVRIDKGVLSQNKILIKGG